MFSAPNVAVFEYKSGKGLKRVTRFTERGVGHAERLAWRELEAQGVRPSQVVRIYSELQPCSIPGGYCSAWISRTFLNARVTWSFEYGTTAASRAAGTAALRAALARLNQ
jgi:hypothetical protein